MESWLSGRKHRTANAANCQRFQGFESLTLREYQSPIRKYWALLYERGSKGFEKSAAGIQDERSECLSQVAGSRRVPQR